MVWQEFYYLHPDVVTQLSTYFFDIAEINFFILGPCVLDVDVVRNVVMLASTFSEPCSLVPPALACPNKYLLLLLPSKLRPPSTVCITSH